MSVLYSIKKTLRFFGLDPALGLRNLGGMPRFISNYRTFIKQKGKDNSFQVSPSRLILNEWTDAGGTMKGHYFHQDLHVAKRIFKNNPNRHIDVGSRIDGFVAHVASYREIEIIDIRPVESVVSQISYTQADMMRPLPKELQECADSVSCLHAIEHFGMGRYGDPIDYDGHKKGIENLKAMTRQGGKLYFSSPIGPQRIEFNAHRVFSIAYLIDILSGGFNIDFFSYVDDKGDFHRHVDLNTEDLKNNYGCHYGCGIFELTKTA